MVKQVNYFRVQQIMFKHPPPPPTWLRFDVKHTNLTKLFLLQQHTFLHRAKKTEFDFDMTLTSSDLDLEITFNILRKLQGNTTIISQNDVKYYISACLMLVFKFDLDLVMTYLHEQD